MNSKEENIFLKPCEEIIISWKKARKRLESLKGNNKEKFDFAAPMPKLNFSITQIETRFLGLLDLLKELKTKGDQLLIPQSYITNIITILETFRNEINQIENLMNQIENLGGGAGNLEKDNFFLQSQNGQQNMDLQGFFTRFRNHIDVALDHYYQLSFLLKDSNLIDFNESFSLFSEKLNEIQSSKQDLDKINSEVTKIQDNILNIQKTATKIISSIETQKDESEKSRKIIAGYEAEVTTNRAKIQDIFSQAETLQNTVVGYKAQFDSFDKQISSRLKTFEDGDKNLKELLQNGRDEQNRLVNKLTEIEEEISRLNKQAEDMLQGATIAGLASEFGKIRDKLTKELAWARVAFYISIVILFASALPLVAYIFPGLGLPMSNFKSFGGGLGEILVRALFLLPGAWFAKFAASRHAFLFRLREHYTYKYSIASSVEGFKKQAEPFKDGIAAATFFELTFNPANNMESEGHGQRHPNKVMEWIMNKLGTTYDGKPS